MGCDAARRFFRFLHEDFQYPRTDRMGCDTDKSGNMPSNWSTFSILERIEWAATRWLLRRLISAPLLSVSSNGSNGLRPTLRPQMPCQNLNFQYPRTDRMGCDGTLTMDYNPYLYTFSILERIEWAATAPGATCARRKSAFSILERIEWAATRGQVKSRPHRHVLSVSSNGSNGLRPRHDARQHLLAGLSVSSNGSNGLRHLQYEILVTERDPFSILERIEWAATCWTPECRSDGRQLSVSSNGSNGLRLHYYQVNSPTRRTLSVSSNGSNGLRPKLTVFPSFVPSTFSILERIEWAATPNTAGLDRPGQLLSVSSNGSNGLRPQIPNFSQSRTVSFSILERIEWAATPCFPFGLRLSFYLSVSSNGSNGLRLLMRVILSFIIPIFQYPRTDRMGCDDDLGVPQAVHALLSVSSNGSNGLRLSYARLMMSEMNSFSILERIEWAATGV